MISRDEVAKLADLSLMHVEDAELDTLAGEIDAILGYVSEVTKLAAEESDREIPELRNVMREDVVTNEPGSYTERISDEMPEKHGAYLRVKKIL